MQSRSAMDNIVQEFTIVLDDHALRELLPTVGFVVELSKPHKCVDVFVMHQILLRNTVVPHKMFDALFYA